MTEVLLNVRNLRVEFLAQRYTTVAVDDVSFDVREGEILGVVGESGAGKSSLANAVIGLIDPPGRITVEEIWLNGRRIDNLGPAAMQHIRGKEIGMTLHDPLTSLDPLYRIGAQLSETILTHADLSRSAARQRALELLADVGIPSPADRIDSYPHEFSGGMRQRVVIALALAAGPKLLIADEPTTALDVSIQWQIIALLKRLCQEHGLAIILISHDMGVIAEAADRVAVLYAGRIVEIGPVAEVVKSPLHPYSRGLMECVPRFNPNRDRLRQIPGAMPRLDRSAFGCAFAPRCSQVLSRCPNDRPQLCTNGPSAVACWLYDVGAPEVGA
jgi:peptide/nickel transport system ATP-binding protein